MLKSLFNWFLQRLPINEFIARHLTQYYLPKNLNFWYFFGSLALFLLFLQVLTGLWLTMFYTPTPEAAFNSIETMMLPALLLFSLLFTVIFSAAFYMDLTKNLES